ncbi:PIN domain-containing protein [Moraxella sp. ZY210820]|uniref:PIN domain-containing protein n=1 Tax=unclassified Moraxella TaxID=2685852 RepID=UPI0027311C3B|nr:PIN domain-containing protein [Moraxella sp. ZY210820]WLF84957.1 PIN domain-containing protein [Moraxella sp. ZY210820]
MSVKQPYFIDSNILLYSIGDDVHKKQIAKQLVRNTHLIISTQVLNEFCNVAFKKKLLTPEQLFVSVDGFRQVFTVMDLTSDLVINALNIKDRYHYSYWDSLIIATALKSGVSILYSEDMAHSQIIDGKLTIINPFIENWRTDV